MVFSTALQSPFRSVTGSDSSNPYVPTNRFDFSQNICFSSNPPKGPKPILSATTQQHLLHEELDETRRFPAAGLRQELLPRHVAVIMDGNRRWARSKGLPIGSGYEEGVRSLKLLVELCSRLGIRVLSVFAFSADNWFRPKLEVEFLMNLIERGFNEEMPSYLRENIRVSAIGDVSKLPPSIQESIIKLQETTKHNSGLELVVAASYSGRYDIVQACQKISWMVKDGVIEPNDVCESLIEQTLQTNCTKFPNPDLLIRTGGEIRVSNFSLWQLAYTELYFSDKLWPDFREDEFVEALLVFQQRKRRFGG